MSLGTLPRNKRSGAVYEVEGQDESGGPRSVEAIQRASDALFLELIGAPLYQRVLPPAELDDIANLLFRYVRTRTASYDMYCPKCKKSSVWNVVLSKQDSLLIQRDDVGAGVNWVDSFKLVTRCSRDANHTAEYYFDVDFNLVDNKDYRFTYIVRKIGQYPSLADFAAGDIEKYAILSHELRGEFKRAINTSAHGFNVAACVHYRRVFERILSEVRDEHLQDTEQTTWPEFDQANTEAKVKLLGDRLPDFLREHPHLYRILSIGVHQLTEEECAAEMSFLRKAIELVLEDRTSAINKRKQREELAKMLAQRADALAKQTK